jgi:hypothetical protein
MNSNIRHGLHGLARIKAGARLAIFYLLSSICLVGCKTAGKTASGEPTRIYDPVKTQQVKDAVTPVVASVVRRVINNSPQHADEIARYFHAVGAVFCSASETGQLGPEQVLDAMDAATAELQAGLDDEIIDGKNLLMALYKINYGDRFKAELPPDQWPRNVADVICDSIDRGLKDAGKPGVR